MISAKYKKNQGRLSINRLFQTQDCIAHREGKTWSIPYEYDSSLQLNREYVNLREPIPKIQHPLEIQNLQR